MNLLYYDRETYLIGLTNNNEILNHVLKSNKEKLISRLFVEEVTLNKYLSCLNCLNLRLISFLN